MMSYPITTPVISDHREDISHYPVLLVDSTSPSLDLIAGSSIHITFWAPWSSHGATKKAMEWQEKEPWGNK